MFDLPHEWVWDFWTADDTAGGSGAHHLFFLKAPRSLGDPELRHRNASVGHATSADLRSWTRVVDALGPQPAPAYDDLATWTGCVLPVPDQGWWMFTSGLSSADEGLVQRIGLSRSPDLLTWSRVTELVLEADPRWYSRPGTPAEEHWRDPWVMRDDEGTWHMYVTAQGRLDPGQDARGHGVVGHATSQDVIEWTVQPPLSDVAGRFDQLEVISVVRVDGRWVLVFSCLGPDMPGANPGAGGVWTVAVDGPGAPVDTTAAVRLTNERLYVGRVLPRAGGGADLLAFVHRDADDAFVGGIIDPVPVVWNDAGTGLRLDVGEDDPASAWGPEAGRSVDTSL